MNLIEEIEKYEPFNEQEANDKTEFLRRLKSGEELYTRENASAHITVSGWVLNKEHNKVLMAYHNIYNSWSWLGGHADGECDLLQVAIKEVKEESGLEMVEAVLEDIFSLEILCVDGHEKKGKYVSSHLHMNVTYLLEAEEEQKIQCKPDENSNVGWFDFEDALERSTEEWFKKRIYAKLNEKVKGWKCV